MHYKFHLTHDPDFDFYHQYSDIIELIHLLISNGSCVYIHCDIGISRAPTIVAAYLMKYHDFSLLESIRFIKQRRPRVLPRHNLLADLECISIVEENKFQNKFQNKFSNLRKRLSKKQLKLD